MNIRRPDHVFGLRKSDGCVFKIDADPINSRNGHDFTNIGP